MIEELDEYDTKPQPRLVEPMSRRYKRAKIREAKNGDLLKTIRLDDGRFVTVRLMQSAPSEVAKAKPDEIWCTGDGRKLLVKDMELKHLLNTIKMLETRGTNAMTYYEVAGQISLQAFMDQLYPIYAKMQQEVITRFKREEGLDERRDAIEALRYVTGGREPRTATEVYRASELQEAQARSYQKEVDAKKMGIYQQMLNDAARGARQYEIELSAHQKEVEKPKPAAAKEPPIRRFNFDV